MATTTTTIAQAASSPGGSDVWVPLLSALFGAIVGGLAASVGAYVLQRMLLKKATRLRMYDELQPALFREYRVYYVAIRAVERGLKKEPVPPPTASLQDLSGELHRAGVISGWREAQISAQIWNLMHEHIVYDPSLNLIWRPNKDLSAMDKELGRLNDQLENQLKRKLAGRPRRLARVLSQDPEGSRQGG